MNVTPPRRLTDTDLTAELSRLARSEREATVALIAHLAEFATISFSEHRPWRGRNRRRETSCLDT